MEMTRLSSPDATLIDRLKSIIGKGGWVTPDDGARYFIDPRGRFSGAAAIILRPQSTQQVSDIVTACAEARVGIVPFGGGTGAVAGHLDIDGQSVVVLSLERMTKIRSADAAADTIIAEAGCTLDQIHASAEAIDRRFGLSLASSASCTIGGNLATNAGGAQTLRYGNARDLCLGVEAVMPDGSVLALGALRKDNTGYDLRHLMIGSEGTLGIITAAALKLSARPGESLTMMVALPGPGSAIALLHDLRAQLGDSVSAFELMSEIGVRLALKHFPETRDPFQAGHPWYAVIELEGRIGLRAIAESAMTQALETERITDAVFAETVAHSRALWSLRELAHDYNYREGAFCSSDTSVPLSQIETFIKDVTAAIARVDPAIRANCYGHIGDGNIHVNLFPPEGVAKAAYLLENPGVNDTVRMIINDVTCALGGSISAEHGVGRLRLDENMHYKSPVEVELMRSVKKALEFEEAAKLRDEIQEIRAKAFGMDSREAV